MFKRDCVKDISDEINTVMNANEVMAVLFVLRHLSARVKVGILCAVGMFTNDRYITVVAC